MYPLGLITRIEKNHFETTCSSADQSMFYFYFVFEIRPQNVQKMEFISSWIHLKEAHIIGGGGSLWWGVSFFCLQLRGYKWQFTFINV